MVTPSKAYLVESALYGDPPPLPEPFPADQPDERAPPEPPASDVPSNFIPGVFTLGSTYDVLNGRYADSRSTKQQVIDWSKSGVRIQTFGNRDYSVPDVVNYTTNTSSDYRSSYGKTTSEYTSSLSVHAGFGSSFPGFSSSASADYSDSQRQNLSNAFTRIALNVTHYNLSLPPTSQITRLLRPWFADDLDKLDPIALYREYGTHILRSLTIGGRALFLHSTDTRSYNADMSIEAAARLSASYLVVSGNMELTTSQRRAMESFNESSQTTVVTRGGDPRFGNEEFLQNVEAWAASIVDWPEFVEFGSLPTFVGIWEFASTSARRVTLQQAYTRFVELYTADLSLPGPYLHARITDAADPSKQARLTYTANNVTWILNISFPTTRSDDWYFLSPGIHGALPMLARELVPGALAPVRWVEVFTGPAPNNRITRFWRAIPSTPDYIAIGFIAVTGNSATAIPSQPPASLAGRFRAIHRLALTGAVRGVTYSSPNQGRGGRVFQIDYRYCLADIELPIQGDSFVLDPKLTRRDWSDW